MRGVAARHELGADLDWLVLTPPPLLIVDDAPPRGYRLGDAAIDRATADVPLSYAELAVAVVDEIETPTRHRAHVGVSRSRT